MVVVEAHVSLPISAAATGAIDDVRSSSTSAGWSGQLQKSSKNLGWPGSLAVLARGLGVVEHLADDGGDAGHLLAVEQPPDTHRTVPSERLQVGVVQEVGGRAHGASLPSVDVRVTVWPRTGRVGPLADPSPVGGGA